MTSSRAERANAAPACSPLLRRMLGGAGRLCPADLWLCQLLGLLNCFVKVKPEKDIIYIPGKAIIPEDNFLGEEQDF